MHHQDAPLGRELFRFDGWDDPALLDREVARRTVRAGSLLVAGASVVFAGIYWAGGSAVLAVPTLVTSAALVLVAFAPFRSAYSQLAVAMAIGLLLLGTQELLLGDLTTGVTVWFLVPNFAAMILGARLLALGGVTFTASVIVVVALAKELGWPIIGNEPAPAQEVVMAVSALGSLAIVGAIARISLGARRQLMAEVNRRNAELAEALAGAHAARTLAIEASEAKDRFFANLTHEIRTPLNGIAGTTELLRQTTLGSDQRPLVAALSASTSNLVLLVNAMLDHARLRAGRMSAEPVPVEVRRAATNLELTFRAQATEKGLDFAVTVEEDMPAWIEVDAIKVRQVLGNLVANAIKFTASGSVTVSVGKAPPDPSQALPAMTVLVTDTGEGIAPDKVDRIFEPFMQADESISRTYGGTGLGLAIARQLTDILDGTLSVQSRPGEGSVFTLRIPFRVGEAPASLPPSPGVAAAPAVGIRVLLVEDNEINRTVLKGMLHLLEAEVALAADGIEAVEAAATGRFQVILMDLQMPRLDGIEAARIIRRNERARGLASVPIIALTGNDRDDYDDACTKAGMDGFLMKPASLAELRDLLGTVAAGVVPRA